MRTPNLKDAIQNQDFLQIQRAMRVKWMEENRVRQQIDIVHDWTPSEQFFAAALGHERLLRHAPNPSVLATVRSVLGTIPMDHVEVFTRDDALLVFTSQPYFKDTTNLLDLERVWRATAEHYRLRFASSLPSSWHMPGSTVLLALWRDRS